MFYPRGSEWRRWDLHVHTPGTKKNDQYVGSSLEEKWDNFYHAIDKYIGDGSDITKNIAVIGITDYLSADNYYKVKKDHRLPESVKMILPNVELRIVPTSKKSPVNIHCLFSPDISEEQLDTSFFTKLTFRYQGDPYCATKCDLIRLGRAVANDIHLEEDAAYRKGIDQFVLTPEDLHKVFRDNQSLREQTIIVVANSWNDGASGITKHSEFSIDQAESQLEATKRSIYQLSDLVFSGNEKDTAYFLGKGPDDIETVKNKCGSLMGCIHGSDAHSIDRLFEPDEKRYCWIKADPTFNGLKQILYEPESRIAISPICPNNKPAYQIIESVTIGDNKIQDDPILFNDYLTCIIGGKSTGKSLLLHNIAFAIDSQQVEDKANVTNTKIDGRKLLDVKVHWKDGSCSEGSQQDGHKVVYIPQTYLNRLSDENEELTEIDRIIEDIVLNNSLAKQAHDEMEREIHNQKTAIDRLIYNVTQLYSDISQKKSALMEIGTKNGIENELKKLKEQKEKLAASASISEDELKLYDSSLRQFNSNKDKLDCISKDKQTIEGLSSVVNQIEISADLSGPTREALMSAMQKVVEQADKEWNRQKMLIIQVLSEQYENTKTDQDEKKKIINSLSPKVEENEAIKKLSQSIQVEEVKLKRYIESKAEIDADEKKLNEDISNLVSSFNNYKKFHKAYERIINENSSVNADDLEFSVETPFRKEVFFETLHDTFDKRSLKSNKYIGDDDALDDQWMTNENIKGFISSCLDGSLRPTKKKTSETALREILTDWYNTTYKVQMDGDSIDGMSPGKKALVLLKMLINLAESTCPILIDQPEDDLDNRSIFEELIPFIKKKKVQRQIIIVTHNANVVLGGDAEEVIVANQDGKKTRNRKSKFEYRSGAIEEDRNIAGRTDILGSRGIQQHICDVLEGGKVAFDLRKHKYHI